MKIIGITGKIGAGKSKLLERVSSKEGTAFAIADEVSHELIKKDNVGYNKRLEVFGDEILDSSGEIDKKLLSDIIFSDDKKRIVVNSILHPAVKNEIIDDMSVKEKEGYKCYFVESAILMEAHFDVFCDEIWYVYADRDFRKERVTANRNISPEKFDIIDGCQRDYEMIKGEYMELEVPFGVDLLDDTEEVHLYKGKPMWIKFDNSKDLLLKDEFDPIMEAVIESRL